MATCSQTNIPDITLPKDECEGNKTSTKCVVHEESLISLGLPADSSLDLILSTFLTVIEAQNLKIESLDNQINP